MASRDDYKAKKGKWEKKYQSEGLGIFSPQNVGILRAIQAKYSNEYFNFFRTLANRFSDTEMEKDLFKTAQAAQSVARNIGILLGSRGRKASEKEIKDLFDSMAKIASKVEYYKKEMAKNSQMAEAAQKAEADTGIGLEGLSDMTKKTEARIAGMKPPKEGAASYFNRVAPELAETGKGLLGGVAQGLLGPFAGIAKMAVGGITGVAKDIKRKRVAKEEGKFLQGISPYGMGVPGQSLESIYGAHGSARTGAGAFGQTGGGIFGLGGMSQMPEGGGLYVDSRGRRRTRKSSLVSNVVGKALGTGAGAGDAEGGGGVGKLSHADKNSVEQGMYKFFEKRAMRAKWTKDVYGFLEEGGVGGKGKGGANLADFFGYGLMMRYAPIILGVLGSLATGLLVILAGAGLGVLLYRLFPDFFEKINEGIEKFFKLLFKGFDTFKDTVTDLVGEDVTKVVVDIPASGFIGLGAGLAKAFMENLEIPKAGAKAAPFSGITGFVSEAINEALGGKVKEWLKSFGEMDMMWSGVTGLGATVAASFKSLVKDFDWLGASMSGIAMTGVGIIDKLTNKLEEAAPGFMEKIKSVASAGSFGAASVGASIFGSDDSVDKTMTKDADQASVNIASGVKDFSNAIPVVLAGGSGLSEVLEGFFASITKDMQEIVKGSKEATATVPVGHGSDVDVYNTRDTVVEYLNVGLLGAED